MYLSFPFSKVSLPLMFLCYSELSYEIDGDQKHQAGYP
jgi:hypothetical protein